MTIVPTPLVKWSVLGEILLVSLVSGIGITGLLSLGIHSLSRSQEPNGTNAAKLSNQIFVGACILTASALVAWGLFLIIHKS